MTARRRLATGILPLLLAAALASCARIGPPAPIVQGTSLPPPAPSEPINIAPSQQQASLPPPSAAVIETVPGDTVVQSGETLFTVARRHNVPMRALIDANNLQPPYVLQSGQRINLPRVRLYQVQPGDTLSSLGRRFGLGTNELVRANAIPPPYALQVGQTVILPTNANLPATVAVVAPPQPGQLPILPGAAPSASSGPGGIETARLPPPTTAPAAPSSPSVVASPPVVVPAPQAMPAPQAAAVPGLPTPRRVEPDTEPLPSRPGRGFQWPLRGPVISDFGSKPGGLQNDGINISAPRGSPIRAADGGTVVYAGNELRGFGNLLLVRHNDGWVTAYAHAEELLVKRGDEVRRGQVIARVGNTGGVTVPQLHFELRKGSRPVNPREFLGA